MSDRQRTAVVAAVRASVDLAMREGLHAVTLSPGTLREVFADLDATALELRSVLARRSYVARCGCRAGGVNASLRRDQRLHGGDEDR